MLYFGSLITFFNSLKAVLLVIYNKTKEKVEDFEKNFLNQHPKLATNSIFLNNKIF